jgi:hypothetical protein
MPWSLGILGDLLWTKVPESRPALAELMVDHIESAMAAGRELVPPLPGEVAPDVLWFPLLEPALDAYPAGRDRLAVLLSVVFDAYRADGPAHAGIRAALENYVFEYLAEPAYRRIVAEVHPDLSALVATATL